MADRSKMGLKNEMFLSYSCHPIMSSTAFRVFLSVTGRSSTPASHECSPLCLCLLRFRSLLPVTADLPTAYPQPTDASESFEPPFDLLSIPPPVNNILFQVCNKLRSFKSSYAHSSSSLNITAIVMNCSTDGIIFIIENLGS